MIFHKWYSMIECRTKCPAFIHECKTCNIFYRTMSHARLLFWSLSVRVLKNCLICHFALFWRSQIKLNDRHQKSKDLSIWCFIDRSWLLQESPGLNFNWFWDIKIEYRGKKWTHCHISPFQIFCLNQAVKKWGNNSWLVSCFSWRQD